MIYFRGQKFLELMDRAEAVIVEVNADKIYTSKEFKRIRDNFSVGPSGSQTFLSDSYDSRFVLLFLKPSF